MFAVQRVIDRTESDFQLHFADDVANFTEFPVGYRLASDGDHHHYIEQAGERIIFPNAKVAIGQRALLLVKEQPLDSLDLV
jgi:succinylglutamate desuccinylase